MADGGLQDGVAGSVVDRQVHVDLRDADESHVAGTVNVQLFLVFIHLLIRHIPRIRIGSHFPVVFKGVVPDVHVFFVAQLSHALGITHDRPGLVHAVPVFTERGIAGDRGADQQDQQKKQVGPAMALFLLLGATRILRRVLYLFLLLHAPCGRPETAFLPVLLHCGYTLTLQKSTVKAAYLQICTFRSIHRQSGDWIQVLFAVEYFPKSGPSALNTHR